MRLFPNFFLMLLLAAALPCSTASASILTGVVSHVTDGDTVWLRRANSAPVQVRLLGIDAPEICQPFGRQARDALAARVLYRPVQITTRSRDMYKRTIGSVSLDGQDVGAWMVNGGFAWSSRHRGRGGPYAWEEVQARQARAGLWAGVAVEPRTFRRRHGHCPRA